MRAPCPQDEESHYVVDTPGSGLETVGRRAALLTLSGCAMLAPSPPANQTNVCEIFREQPEWYDYARASQEKWGTPIAT